MLPAPMVAIVDPAQREAARLDPLVRTAFEALLRHADDPEAVLRIVAFRRERMAYLCGEQATSPTLPPELSGDPTGA